MTTVSHLVTAAGTYLDMPEDVYHADPIPAGSLSVSGAKKLLPPSVPAIFRYEQDHPPEPKDVFDFGSAAHRLLLGSGAEIGVVDASDWKSTAARARREEIRDAGQTPILAKDFAKANEMVEAVHAHPFISGLFSDGAPEVSMFWQHNDLWRRGRMDWLTEDTVIDYKTAACAEPDTFARAAASYGYDMQAAWYLDGALAVGLDVERFLFVVQEKTPPYLLSVVELDSTSLAAGRAKNAQALDIYATCSLFDSWPGYGDGVTRVRLPEWALRGAS